MEIVANADVVGFDHIITTLTKSSLITAHRN